MTRDTSSESYRDLIDTDILGKRQAETLTALIKVNKQHGAVTGAELFRYGFDQHNSLKLTNIRSRLGELRDMGSIEERPKRRCTVSKKRALTWYFTGDKPKKVNKISKGSRKTMVKDYLTTIYSQNTDKKLRADLKVLWNMIKGL